MAIEEPLEIRVDGEALAVTMRTPGEDEELAAGFLAGEALISGPADIASVGPTQSWRRTSSRSGPRAACAATQRRAPLPPELVLRRLRQGGPRARPARGAAQRAGPARSSPSSSCGCRMPPGGSSPASSGRAGFTPRRCSSAGGRLLVLREDVGRHNAMDKAIGALLLAGRWPLPGAIACLSGRAGFELVQKASLAGLAGVVAIGAPTSLAVRLAAERRHAAVRVRPRELVQRLRGSGPAGRRLSFRGLRSGDSGDREGDGRRAASASSTEAYCPHCHLLVERDVERLWPPEPARCPHCRLMIGEGRAARPPRPTPARAAAPPASSPTRRSEAGKGGDPRARRWRERSARSRASSASGPSGC